MTVFGLSLTVIWLIIAALLLTVEILGGTVVALCMSIGSLLAVIPAAIGASFTAQVLTAVIASILAMIFLGPFIKRLYDKKKSSPETTSNMEALIGRTGKVIAPVTNNFDDKGRVRIDGDNWLAYTTSPDWPIQPGEQVEVESYESIVLRVRPIRGNNIRP